MFEHIDAYAFSFFLSPYTALTALAIGIRLIRLRRYQRVEVLVLVATVLSVLAMVPMVLVAWYQDVQHSANGALLRAFTWIPCVIMPAGMLGSQLLLMGLRAGAQAGHDHMIAKERIKLKRYAQARRQMLGHAADSCDYALPLPEESAAYAGSATAKAKRKRALLKQLKTYKFVASVVAEQERAWQRTRRMMEISSTPILIRMPVTRR